MLLLSDEEDDVTDNDESINLSVDETNFINDDDNDKTSTIKQDTMTDQSSHDLEAGSHEHKDSSKQKLTVNGFSYRKLLEEEMEDSSKQDTIVMEDLAAETSDGMVKQKNSNLMGRLKLVKDQITSTLLILISLLK